ncbi:MAG: nodulation protein NfeD, partial [Mycolicibacterium sp.]|nr:nodulation protein NfeD [Mycolicibacterium sp.]
MLVLFCLAVQSARPAPPGAALVIALDGPIGPASAAYVVRNLAAAQVQGAAVVVLRLDTPGGLDDAMRTIVRTMLASPVPVLAYVAPSGARAASAGTYILYASALAAMAPGTNLGAATPVSLFGEAPLLGTPPSHDGAPGRDDHAAQPANAELTKVTNDAAAFIRGLATMHGRNADWAERSVREAVSLSYEVALHQHVVDVIASDVAELLAQADGRTVLVAGRRLQLATKDLQTREIAPDWRDRLLATLTNPAIVYLLLLLGLAGIAFELSHPGIFAPGVIGTICLLLGGYGLNLLPIDYAGVALVVFGLALMVTEAFLPAFGAFVVGGGAALLLGSLLMFDNPGFRPSLVLIGTATATCMGLFGVV